VEARGEVTVVNGGNRRSSDESITPQMQQIGEESQP